MPNNIGSRIAVIACAAVMAGVTLTAAIFEGLVFTDWTNPIVIMGLVAALIFAAAALFLMSSPQTGALLAMLGGLVALVIGVVEIAIVGLVWSGPSPWQVAQPAWLQEFVYIVAGALVAGLALRVWRPRQASQIAGPHPA